VPTKLDPDGDWDLTNNVTWLKQTATSIIPAVYYNVAETRTHYFIHYMLYFPWVNQEASVQFGNGSSGYMVTVEKARPANGDTERPISVHTYFTRGPDDDINQGFVTTESDIASTTASGWCAHEELDQADLFPDGRFDAYVTSRSVRACMWAIDDDSFGTGCPNSAEIRGRNHLVFEFGGNNPTPVAKVNSAWPTNMAMVEGVDAYKYILIPALSTVWTRRQQDGANEIFQLSTPLTYAPDMGRPGMGLELPTRFKEPMEIQSTLYGRPFWGWGYSVSSGSCDTAKANVITRGQMAIDPAWYVWERHTKASAPDGNGIQMFDIDDNTGFSVDYCFNALIGVDTRTTDVNCQ
jgi:hypothetical protein